MRTAYFGLTWQAVDDAQGMETIDAKRVAPQDFGNLRSTLYFG